ncbi:uncharacterized protein LOC132304389 [Cornus florida]|uniref:uncharacterized protein LOC132304389 n=1 Tax=Cornus florida TaxID=4283 RepID=UPI00289AB22A|nr:uncharacterized protein LOC132304389 [Cornus florida]XP_059658037.1 uncharacterized protein LOC132304389 [Cornus florida]
MEYEEEKNCLPGTVPEFGAIFMSNIATKRECLKRKLLGLPSSYANFVKQVKAGMVLFLFEFERRELYGVFRACSDGGFNIAANAFTSSGKQFPAQVRFAPFWYCSPLSEHEFRNAIKENYFSAKKFHFGLSEDQVHRLLSLFSSRREHNKLPPTHFARQDMNPMKKHGRVVDDDNFLMSNRIEVKPGMGSGLGPANLTEYQRNPENTVGIVHDDRSLTSDRVENEHNVYNGPLPEVSTKYPRNSSVKIRRIDDDVGRFLVSDAAENECNLDYGLGRVTSSDSLGDSLYKVRRTSADGQFVMSNRLESEHHTDNNTWPIISSECPGDSLGSVRRVADDGLFPMSDRVGEECNTNRDLGSVTSTKHLGNLLGKVRKEIDDGRFLMNVGVENELTFDNCLRPAISGNLRGEVRRAADDGRFLVNDKVEDESRVENGIVPGILTKSLRSPLGKGRRSIDDRRYLMSDRVENELNLENGIAPVISFEHLKNPLDRVRRATNDGWFLTSDRIKNEFNVDDGSGAVISSDEYSRYHLGIVRGAADDGGFAKSDKLEHGTNFGNRFRPVVSSEYTALCQAKQSPFVYSSNHNLETDYALVQDQVSHSSAYSRSIEPQNFDFFHPSSHDAIATRAVPYDPEVPKAHYSHSPSFGVDYNSDAAQDCSRYYGSLRNLASSTQNQLSPYRLESKGSSMWLDTPSRYGNKVPLPTTSNHHNFSDLRTSNSSSCAGYSENKELEYSERAFVHSSRREIYGSENMGALSHAFTSKDPSFIFDEGDVSALREKYKQENSWDDGGGASHLKDFPSPNNSRYHLRRGAFSSDSQVNRCHDKDSTNYTMEFYQSSEGVPCDNRKSRVSVFSRLTSAPEVCLKENNTNACHDESGTDVSLNEVVNMLKQSQNHRMKRIRKSNPLVNRHSDDKISGIKKQTSICNQLDDKLSEIKKQTSICNQLDDKISGIKRPKSICNQLEYDQSRIMMKMKIDANLPVTENGCQLAEETRLVDFKRRSEKMKTPDGIKRQGKANGSVHNEDGEGLVDQPRKRRKLIRPVFFSKKEAFDGGISGDKAQNLLRSSQEHVICKDNPGNCDDSVSSHKKSNRKYQNARLVHGVSPTSCEGNKTSADQSSKWRGETNSENCEASLRCIEGQDGNKVSQNVDIQNAITRTHPEIINNTVGSLVIEVDGVFGDLVMTDHSKNADEAPTLSAVIYDVVGGLGIEDAMVDEMSRDLGMTDHSKNAEEAPPDVQYVNTNSEDGRGKGKDLLRGFENVNRVCPIRCDTAMNNKPNKSLCLLDLNLEIVPEDCVGMCSTSG